MGSAFDHNPTITVPSSSTNNALVKWSGTGGKTFLDSTIIVGATTMGLAADTDLVTFASGTLTIAGTLAATALTGDGSALTGISAGTALTGTTDNTLVTVTGANAITGEANLTWSGTMLQQGPVGSMPLVSGTWAANYSGFMCNAYYAGGWKYSGNNPAMGIRFHAAGSYANSMLFNVAPVNSSGAAATISNWDGADIKMIINSDGQVTKPKQSCGLVRVVSDINNQTGNGNLYQVPFNDAQTGCFDVNDDWNNTANTFYAPVDGKYWFSVSISFKDNLSTDSTEVYVCLRTDHSGGITYNIFNQPGRPDGIGTGNPYSVGGSILIALDEGEYINCAVRVSGDGSDNVQIEGGGAFASYLSWMLVA